MSSPLTEPAPAALNTDALPRSRHPEIGIADAQDLDQAPPTTQAPDFDNAYVTHLEHVTRAPTPYHARRS
jgi:hypothetical protein